ncbi:MAG: M23 family metallopeptidase [Bacteroidales bacterium]|nr:M23 family metallopeptidase [Bacteroidales bacterium]
MGKKSAGERKTYRLSFMEDDTSNTLKSIRFSKMSLTIWAIIAVVVLIFFFYAIIAFTPLRTTIPGYPDAHSKRVAVANAIKIDSLESSITRWELYAKNLSRILSGEETLSADSLIQGGAAGYLERKSAEELARQDSLLKATVLTEEQAGISGSSAEKKLPLEGRHFFCPLKGVISNGFDIAMHPYVDITAPANSVVCATLDGTVIYSVYTDASGHTIALQHEGNIVSIYTHNVKLLKKVGDKVKAGTPIALVGNSASLTAGDHLHFELWYNGTPVNPTDYISF